MIVRVQSSKFKIHRRETAGFTMIEIAICLAIIGIALVGIIAVLPLGMHTQRDNRQETLIAQDANFLMDLVRNGSHGPDDLTNYIYAVTNYWAALDASGNITVQGVVGYDYNNATKTGGTAPAVYNTLAPINSGSNIVSLLSIPEYMYADGTPINNLWEGGYSNHVVAYVRAISGLAAEKGPQANQILQEDSFTYRMLVVNAPMPMDLPPIWNASLTYQPGDKVYLGQKSWVAVSNILAGDMPGLGLVPLQDHTNWNRYYYPDQLAANQRELRLRFAWPQLPNGALAANSRFINFRTTVAGQLMATNDLTTGRLLYFYRPQIYSQIP